MITKMAMIMIKFQKLYKNIRNKCVSIQSHTEYGYYGSSETRICWRCDLIKLYEELNKLNKI